MTVFCILLFWLRWQVWVVDPAGDKATSLSLQIAFASAVATFFTVFIAGALGYFAVREFSETHQTPYLVLTARPGEVLDRIDRTRPIFSLIGVDRDRVEKDGLTIYIMNATKAYSSRYVAELQLPHVHVDGFEVDHIEDVMGAGSQYVEPLFGELEQWTLFSRYPAPKTPFKIHREAREFMRDQRQTWVRFIGREGSELFPDIAVPFCTFRDVFYRPDKEAVRPFDLHIQYRIGLLEGEAIEGDLVVTFAFVDGIRIG